MTRWLILQKARRHTIKVLRLLVGARFQVLFHSPPGVLFTFPSRYWCAIGHRVVLRLGWWSTQVRTGFHVPGPTQGPRRAVRSGFAYGAVTRCGRPSHAVPLPSRTCARGRQPPDARPCNPVGGTPAGYARSTVWPSVPIRSPLLGESRDRFTFFRVHRCFSSPGCPPPAYAFSGGISTPLWMGSPIRRPPGRRMCAPRRGLSQLAASFIGSLCQGIRRAPVGSCGTALGPAGYPRVAN